MKLLHVAPYAEAAYGGPNTALRQMTAVAAAQGIEVHVAVTNAAGVGDLGYADGDARNEDGATFHYFHRVIPRGWFRSPSMGRWLESHVEEFDLLHLHVPFTAPFRMAASVARKVGCPYLVTPHGLLDPWSMQQKSWKKRPYLRFLERENLASAALLHATSGLESRYVSALGLGPKVRNLPLAVGGKEGAQAKHSNMSGEVRLLCIARIHPVKALPVLFQSLKSLADAGCRVSLDLAGDGDPDYVANLKALAERLGIASQIIWHGYVGAEQKQHLYSRADAFVLISYHENFGLAAAEALRAGVPVIVSDQVGLAPEVAEFGAGVVVPVGGYAAIVDAVLHLASEDVQQQSSQAANELAAARFSVDAFSHGLIALYHEALKQSV